MNALITSAGRRVSLVREFQFELKKKYQGSKVYTTDSKPELSAACQVSDEYFKVPPVSDKEYVNFLLSICINNKIKIVIPTIDTELIVFAENKHLFNNHNIEIIISGVDLVKSCRNKRLTHALFDKYGICRAKDIDKNELQFPLFIKPFDGSCSKDIFVIHDQDQLRPYHLQNDNFMFLEYFDIQIHTEFTVDTYYDKENVLKAVIPRERIEIRSGEVNKGITRKNELFQLIKTKFNKFPGAVGCVTMQFFQNTLTKNLIGIEINPRFGGGYPLSYLAGANFPKWIIEEYYENAKIEYFDEWEENLLMLRYDDEILVKNAKL